MLLVLAMAGTLWGIGAMMKTPTQVRWIMIGLLWVGVVALHVILPVGHPLRLATGEQAAPWVLLGGATAVVIAYRKFVLGRLRGHVEAREAAEEVAKPQGQFVQTELERYARHIVLREIGGPGQKALKQSKVLVIGAGGLGSPALLYLAAAGVGRIGVIDDDEVDHTNLQRQVIHTDARIGMPKVHSAAAAMADLNPYVDIRPYKRRLTEEIAADLFEDYDLILDGTDNFETRYMANRVAHAQGKPLISGALSQWEGQVSVFDTTQGTPCYQCIFPEAPAPGLAPSCAEAGVVSPLPGVVGSMMATEAVKIITGAGAPLRGQMLIYDALYGETRKITLTRRMDCPVCGAKGEVHDQSAAE